MGCHGLFDDVDELTGVVSIQEDFVPALGGEGERAERRFHGSARSSTAHTHQATA